MSEHSAELDGLLQQLQSLVEGARQFQEKHGSVRVTVGPNAPVALAQIQQVAGFWIEVDQITLMSTKGEDDLVIDGDLVYYRAAEHGEVGATDIVGAIDWLGSMREVRFDSADWSSVDKTGAVYLEGRVGDDLVEATFVLRDFSVHPDWDADLSNYDWGDDDA